jgi:hypothetical protein
MREDAPPTFAFAADWLRAAGPQSSGVFAASNLFPTHFADDRAPNPFGQTAELQLRQAPPSHVAVVIGYQDPPQIAIDAATLRRTKVFYTSSRRDAADGRQEVLYVDPHWPVADACVEVRGYDIPILPASSVMQAAVYWSLVAETTWQPTRRGPLMATSRTPGE